MESAGLEPAGVDGGWFQPVALIESTLQDESSSFEITINGEPMGLTGFGRRHLLEPEPGRTR
jgi:hypothetical protein